MEPIAAESKNKQQALEPDRVRIPAGYFLMGSETFSPYEAPIHRVWVDEFELGKYTVTNREYRCFLDGTNRNPPPFFDREPFNHPDQPVVGVSWFDAADYCAWLSRRTSSLYRLPTEAEWERAARSGHEGRLYPWGDGPPEAHVNYPRRWLGEGPEIVGLYAPNDYGLYNMGENVHEWCTDWFDEHYYAASPERNPQGPRTGARRAARGGSWRHQIKVTRCAARSSINPQFHYSDFGFRVARPLGCKINGE